MDELKKAEWIDNYASNLMATYSVLNYDTNCSNGWGEKEQFLDPEEAYHLAEKAWDRLVDFKDK